MLLATIDLEADAAEVLKQTEDAGVEATRALRLARGFLVEVFGENPGEYQHQDGKGRSLLVLGKEVFQVRYDAFPEKVLVRGEWLVDARRLSAYSHPFGGGSWDVRL